MKKLYSFKGKLGDKDYEFILKKPSRTEIDEIEILYAALLSKYMNSGIQTRAAVDKYYADNTNGAMTKEDEKEIIKLRQELLKKEDELKSSIMDKDKRIALYEEVTSLSEKIRNFNSYYSAIYDNTAEVKARNKTIDFCLLNLSYIKVGEEEKVLFAGEEEDPSQRMALRYESFEKLLDGENSDFYKENIDKLIFLFTLWYLNTAETEEEFDIFYKQYYGEIKEPVEEMEEPIGDPESD